MTLNPFSLHETRVAVFLADGLESDDFLEVLTEIRAAGGKLEILAMNLDQMRHGIRTLNPLRSAIALQPDRMIRDAVPDEYQGLLILGGPMSVDQMRDSRFHQAFVQNLMEADRPIGTISHGAWLLADAGVLLGKTLTSWPTIRRDLERAGAIWKDQDVIEDGNLVTGRGPVDMHVFTRRFLTRLSEPRQVSRTAPLRAAS